ncbi:MAG: ABC transporter ATP-binding protein [Treponema sp.]|nr:ABC transporter ATP-binding protein [Treponema sp.]
MSLVSIEDLTKRYGSKTAIDKLNLELDGGQIIGLLGPNGSGKTTLIKMMNGLLVPNSGRIRIEGNKIGVETKALVSYLPDQTYLNMNQKVSEIISFFADFYSDFDVDRAYSMLEKLGISADDRLKKMSKGTKEKVQLILVMSRRAKLYILDEPIAGVDPAARDYILDVILSNYDPDSTIIISTHLISDIEKILDRAIFIRDGKIVMNSSVDDIRMNEGKSVDSLFREVFKC